MKKPKEIGLEFEIDKLTDSIENSISGETLSTQISRINTTKKVKKTDFTVHLMGNII